MFSALAGGVMAAVMAVHFMLDAEANLRGSRAVALFRSFQPNVPYGLAFAAGAILALPSSWWMTVAAASP
jgi:Flp pilus assembly protein protease CpaA